MEEQATGFARIAAGIVLWNKALVSPEPMNAFPGHCAAEGLVGQHSVDPQWRRTAAQAHGQSLVPLRQVSDNPLDGSLGKRLRIGQNGQGFEHF
jgi:hypothetical protein